MLSWISACVRGRKKRMKIVGQWEIKTQEVLREQLTIRDWAHEDMNKHRRKEVKIMLRASATWWELLLLLVTIFQLFSQSPPRGHRFSPSFATLSITRTKYWPVNWSNKRTHNKDSRLQARMRTDAWRSGRPWWPKILEPLIHSSKPAMKTAVVNHPNARPFRTTWPQSGICKRVWREISVFENTDQRWTKGHVCEDKKTC